MRIGRWGLAAVAAGLAVTAARANGPDGARWWSHVAVLADDSMEGRETGSAGHRRAADYVAREFARLGLKPGGTNGYLVPVKLVSRTIDEPHSSLTLVRPSGDVPLTLGKEAVISLRVDPAPSVEADLVFAGHGLSIPEVGHDDFAGLDVRGKLVVYLSGAPPTVPGPLAAHAQSAAERTAALRKAGAVGTVAILNPGSMDIPWERSSLARFLPSMNLADPAFDDNRGLALGVGVNPAFADVFLEGTGHTFKEILAAADAGKPLPRFAIPAKLKGRVAVTRAEVVSENVVGVLPGSDPKLKGESVAFSAHLDHLGVGKPVNGDPVYNGAMDNAAGIATMLDVAEILKETGVKPRRSIVFVAVTGEEKGLLGSRLFASGPPPGLGTVVADVNTDMFLPLYPFKRLTVYGLNESDVGEDAAAVATAAGILPEGDPEPKRNAFIRSDQYSFIREGVPAVALKVGYEKGTAEEQAAKAWLKERYHAPSDDLKQPVDRASAGAFNAVVAKLLARVADRDARPRWKGSSFFKRYEK